MVLEYSLLWFWFPESLCSCVYTDTESCAYMLMHIHTHTLTCLSLATGHRPCHHSAAALPAPTDARRCGPLFHGESPLGPGWVPAGCRALSERDLPNSTLFNRHSTPAHSSRQPHNHGFCVQGPCGPSILGTGHGSDALQVMGPEPLHNP